jgi:hypothetical protein
MIFPVFCSLLLMASFGLPQQANMPPSLFVGEWVGTQSWAIEDPPPGILADQPVRLTIEMVEGRLEGQLSIFGGSDTANFTEVTIVGDELQATAMPGEESRERWKGDVEFLLKLKLDDVRLAGTADVRMGGVDWMKYDYNLSKRRTPRSLVVPNQ